MPSFYIILAYKIYKHDASLPVTGSSFTLNAKNKRYHF